jgi:hypothetical protein
MGVRENPQRPTPEPVCHVDWLLRGDDQSVLIGQVKAVTVELTAELLAFGEIRLVAMGPQHRAEQSRLGNRPGQQSCCTILDGTRDELPGEIRRTAGAMGKP